MASDVAPERGKGNPFARLGFFWIRLGRSAKATDQHMIVLVLNEPVQEFHFVDEAENFFELRIKPHLFFEPAVRGPEHGFARPGMTAAGIRPQPSGVVLAARSTLQEKFSSRVKDEDGKGAVKQTLTMGNKLAHRPNLPIARINKNNLFGFHAARWLLPKYSWPRCLRRLQLVRFDFKL